MVLQRNLWTGRAGGPKSKSENIIKDKRIKHVATEKKQRKKKRKQKTNEKKMAKKKNKNGKKKDIKSKRNKKK